MPAKRFVATSLLTIVVLVFGSVGINYARQHTRINNGNATNVCQYIEMKRAMLARTADTSGRIILFGFSNMMFGTRAELLAEKFERPVLNFGVNASMSDSMAFQFLSQSVSKGDTLILEMPYWYFTSPDRIAAGGDSVIRSLSVSCVVNGLDWLPLKYVTSYLLFQNPLEMAEGVSRMLFGGWWISPLRITPQFVTDGSNTMFNEAGDTDAHRISQRTAAMEQTVEANPQRVGRLRMRWDSVGVKLLDQLIEDVTSRGVQVVAVWPVAYDVDPIEPTPIVADLERYYAERSIPVLGRPDDFRYPRENFFDSANHLTLEASIPHTEQLAALLKASGLLPDRTTPAP